jgi:hypothetical protein
MVSPFPDILNFTLDPLKVPLLSCPAPEIVAVTDSGLTVPAAFLVVTTIYAAGVVEAVATAEITASDDADVEVPINALDRLGSIVDDSEANAATVSVISRTCTLAVNSVPELYGVNVAVQTYVPGSRPPLAVAVSTNALKVAAATEFAADFNIIAELDSVRDGNIAVFVSAFAATNVAPELPAVSVSANCNSKVG